MCNLSENIGKVRARGELFQLHFILVLSRNQESFPFTKLLALCAYIKKTSHFTLKF